jgi:hypothetical protein
MAPLDKCDTLSLDKYVMALLDEYVMAGLDKYVMAGPDKYVMAGLDKYVMAGLDPIRIRIRAGREKTFVAFAFVLGQRGVRARADRRRGWRAG